MTYETDGIKLVLNNKNEKFPEKIEEALEVIKNYCMLKKATYKQIEAQKRARAVNSDNARKKIENAINVLRIENKAINMRTVSLVSGCSINTVRKYREFIEKQNEI